MNLLSKTRALAWCLILSGLFTVCIASANADQPNIIVILTDDQGWGDLSAHGNTNLSTPNIDRLAAEGMAFDRFYVSPICSPTRAEFMTGRYNPRTGVKSASRGEERLDLDETTVFADFKAAGYRTAAFGKWHNGMQPPYHPNARGIEEYYGFCSGHWGDYYSPMLEHNGEIVTGEGFLIDDFTTRAMDYMEKHREEPFFIYLPYCTPHSPMQVPDRWWEKFKDHDLPLRAREDQEENLQHARAALAMCENIDWNVGRVLEKLDELDALGISEKTYVVFTTDNGGRGIVPGGDRSSPAPNVPLSGAKHSLLEGGIRVPLMVRGPSIEAGSVCRVPVVGYDFLPTFYELAGGKGDLSEELDGGSFVSLFPNPETDSVKRPIDGLVFSRPRQGMAAIRAGEWKLLAEVNAKREIESAKLFNVVEDIAEEHDLSTTQAEKAKQLHARLQAYLEAVVDPSPTMKRRKKDA